MRAWRDLLGASILLTLAGCGDGAGWNVVLVTFDTTRADHIGAYGALRAETPNLDALASEGARFEQAYTSTPITAPSHSTIMTGRYPLAHGVRDNGLFVLGPEQRTLAEILGERGYRTAAAVGSFPLSSQFGLDQGFELYDDRLAARFGFLEQDDGPSIYFDERPAELVNEAVEQWLEEVAGERFFLWLHYYDPHQPLRPPPPYDQLFLDDPYSGEITYADEAFGAVLQRLRDLGAYDRTLVIFTSDHGEGLGEHNEETHSMLLYQSTLRVPLIVRAPGSPGGLVIDDPVGLVDIAPTVLDLLGLPPLDAAQGRSLAAAVRDGEELPATPLYAETLSPRLAHGWGELRALIDRGRKYVHGPRPELFDLRDDRDELHDLQSSEPELAERMRRDLDRFIREHATQAQSVASIPDEETRRRLMALGYLSVGAGAGVEIVEKLRSGGTPPQDRIGDVNDVSRGKLLLIEGRALQAEEVFRGLLAGSPDSPMYNEMLASALLSQDRLDEARAALESVRGGDAGASERLWSYLALRRLARGEVQAALEVSERAAERFPSAPVFFVRAQALRGVGDAVAAEEALERTLELDPDHLPARIDLALRFARRGELERAASELESVLAKNPYSPRAHYNYARVQLDLGDDVDAQRHFVRAIRLDPEYLLARYALVALRFGVGDVEGAREAFSALRARAPESAETERAARLLEGGA